MQNRNGYVLIGLLLFFSVITLSGTVAVLEQDTRLKRFTENEAKGNVDSLRRAIDLYRYKYTHPPFADQAKIDGLNADLANNVNDVITRLTEERFLRSHIATGSMRWRKVENLIKNSSFEEDEEKPSVDYYVNPPGWQGNYHNDEVPNGWQYLDSGGGIEQYIYIPNPATYVTSLWVKGNSSTAHAKIRVLTLGDALIFEMQVGQQTWKRYYGSFQINPAQAIKFQLLEDGTDLADKTYSDGVMLEQWNPPTGYPATLTPVPSAWVDGRTLVPDVASQVVQKGLLQDVIGSDTNQASFSYWLEW